jgi:hypothetical protein
MTTTDVIADRAKLQAISAAAFSRCGLTQQNEL